MTKHESPETLLTHLRDIQLPEEARVRMRAELAAFADLHTPSAATVSSSRTFSGIAFWTWRIAAVFVLMIGVVGGSAYASADAQPGTPLYALRLRVAEPVQTALIPTPEGRAAWHAILAERRLEEAATVAVSGSFTTSLDRSISDNFMLQVEKSLAASRELETTGKTEGALLARADLEARITAHEQILERVAAHVETTGSSLETQTAAHSVLALVRTRQAEVATARADVESAVTLALATRTEEAPTPNARIHMRAVETIHDEPVSLMSATAPVSVEAVRDARDQEIEQILTKHAALLSVLATTTATSTEAASTTSATSTPGSIPGMSQ